MWTPGMPWPALLWCQRSSYRLLEVGLFSVLSLSCFAEYRWKAAAAALQHRVGGHCVPSTWLMLTQAFLQNSWESS